MHNTRVAVTTIALLAAATAHAQTYPSKSIRLIVPFPPGGPADALARPLAQKLSESLGQPVVVDNRPGATGTIGASLVAKAAADGYTLLLGTSNELTMSPGLYEKLPYHPSEDFTPLTPVIVFPNILVTHPALPPKTETEFVALARARPGAINFATSGAGGTTISPENCFSVTQIKINFVPYKGGGPAVVDLMGGHVEALFVTDQKRWRIAPDVPNAKEAGMPSVNVITWNGVLGPAGLPAAIRTRLHTEIVTAANAQDMKERMAAQAADVATTSVEEFAAMLRRDFALWIRVIKDAGIRLN